MRRRAVEDAARSALASIDAGDWKTWVRAGLAPHTEYGDAGFEDRGDQEPNPEGHEIGRGCGV